jgi:hypothetical protein
VLYQLPRPGPPEESWLRPYAAKSLDLRERLLDRVEICRVGRRVDELEPRSSIICLILSFAGC